MACSCKGPSCNCLERCCCPSESCVCMACFRLRNAKVVKNEENKPFECISNESRDSQKSATNTYRHLKDEESIKVSNPSCNEIESDVIFIGSYNTSKKTKKCSSQGSLFPEIILSDSEDEPVFTDGGNKKNFKITPENMNRSRNLEEKGFCNLSNNGAIPKRKISWNNCKSDQNSHQGIGKKANISRFQNRSHTSLEQNNDIAGLHNPDIEANEYNFTENANFNRYFSQSFSSHSAYDAQENGTKQESPVSNTINDSLKSETNKYINENYSSINSDSKTYFSEATSSCSASKSQESETMQQCPVSNVRENSLKSETYECINEKDGKQNSNFKRYFSDGPSFWNVSDAQENKIQQETPASNFRNDSLQLETNRCCLFTQKYNCNRRKRNCSWNNSSSAQNGKKTFSEMATILQPNEGTSTSFGQRTDLTSATATQTTKDRTVKSSTLRGNCRENFPDVSVYDFDEKDNAINLSDRVSLTHGHVQSDNSGGLKINISPSVSHRGYTKNNSLQNIDGDESDCKAKQAKHVSFLLPPCHSSSEICNDYRGKYRNFSQNTNDESGYTAAKMNELNSFINPSCHNSSENCSVCQTNYRIQRRIRKLMRQNAKRYKRKRTFPIDKFTRKKIRYKGRRWKRNNACDVGQAANGNEIKKEKIYIKKESNEENGFVKTEINYIKREIKKEEP